MTPAVEGTEERAGACPHKEVYRYESALGKVWDNEAERWRCVACAFNETTELRAERDRLLLNGECLRTEANQLVWEHDSGLTWDTRRLSLAITDWDSARSALRAREEDSLSAREIAEPLNARRSVTSAVGDSPDGTRESSASKRADPPTPARGK